MNPHQKRLNVLLVEDLQTDAELIALELERAGYAPDWHRVETAEQLSQALQNRKWDLVMADFQLPQFDGLSALELVKQRGLDLPFIIVSAHISDATAVRAMKAGAHDYVMKDNLARLGPAVERELREAESRRQRRLADDRLKVESAFRRAIENSIPAGISVVDLDGRQTYVNPAFCNMVGWTETDLVGAHPPFLYWPPEESETITASLSKVIAGSAPQGGLELRFRRRSGERFQVLLQITPLRDSFGNLTGWVSAVSDITERKRAEIRLAAEHAITRILANAQNLNEAAPGIVQVLLDSLEVDYGALYTIDPKHEVLMPLVTTLRTSPPELKPFLQESRRLSFSRGEHLPGRVWETRRAFWVPDLSEETELRRRGQAMQAGLRSVIAFPIQNGPDFFGVLEFFSVAVMERDPALLNMMTAIGSEIGQFIQRRSAEEALRRAYDDLEVRVQQRTTELRQANAKLQASIAERKRLENELLEITERERRRIGLDLHDDLGQKLSGIALMTKGLELKLAKTHAQEAQDAAKIHGLVHEAMNHASDLAHDLATLDLKQDDLPAALEGLSEHAKELFGITCRFKSEGKPPPLDASVVKQLYKIAQEGVTNAIKHGKAKRVTIALAAAPERLILSVQNDGVPFPDLHGQSTGMGLRIMNYRASLIGGALQIKANGSKGTILTCSLPLEARTEAARQSAA